MHLFVKLFISILDDSPVTRRDIKILLRYLEEQNEIIQRLENKVTGVRKLLDMGRIDDYTSTDEFINVSIFIFIFILIFYIFKFKTNSLIIFI